MFTNKHVIVAVIVAPLLAVLAYYVTDQMVKENPHAAIPGQAYELLAQSDCRNSMSHCTFKNGNLELLLIRELNSSGHMKVLLHSSHFLSAVEMSIIDESTLHETEGINNPINMQRSEGKKQEWNAIFENVQYKRAKIRLVALEKDTYFYAETSLKI